MCQKIVFPNGLRVLVIPQKNTQAVTVLVLVGTGSKYEEKKLNGISHFLEHMLFKGTKKRPTSQAISETLDRVGGIYNAFTSDEYTGYFVKVKNSFFDLALDWVSDIFLNSTLPDKEVEKERGVIKEEINMHYDNPMSYIQILWTELLYGDQPAGWPITGTKKSIQRISRRDLINYKNFQYVAKNTLICVAGNFEKKKAIKTIEKSFSKIKNILPKEKPKTIEKQKEPNLLLHFRKTDQAHICLGVRGYDLFHPQRYTLKALADILGGMMSSRLWTEIREKLNLAYYVFTETNFSTDTGYLVTRVGLDVKNIEKGVKTILREYKKIGQKSVSAKELKKAKDHLKGKMALSLETSDNLAFFYGLQELLKKEIFSPEEIYKKFDKIRGSDILKTARDVFRPSKLNLAIVGPFKEKDKEKFKKLLKF